MFTSSFILTDGANLETFAGGAGATTICTAHNFDVTTPHGGLAMEAFANVTRTIGVNLRAMGGSSREADPTALSMVQAVRDLEAVRSALGLKQWIFAGFSAGGFIGLHYALMFPRALQGLILIGTAPSYRVFLDPASIYCRKNPHYATVQGVQGTQRWSAVVWPLIARRPDLVERAGRDAGGISEERQAAQVAEMPSYDLEPRLSEIRVPTLVIHGRHDASMPLSQGEIIASAIHDSALVVLEESGHFPFWEQPREFEQAVAAFVRRVEGNSRAGTTIREAAASDAAVIANIYNHYVTETVVTFEEEPVPAAEIARRIEEVRSASLPWLVAEVDGDVVGYAYARPWHERSAYRFSVEITVYLAPTHVGRGIGSRLYGELFPILQARRIHAVIGGIALPNEASVALHEKFGLRKAAHFEEVGFKFDRWIDVGYWQRTF